jgi:hypothetical protein
MHGTESRRARYVRTTRDDKKNTQRASMTAQQYLQNQAEHCRRSAAETADPFVADELRRLAAEFDWRARETPPSGSQQSRAA